MGREFVCEVRVTRTGAFIWFSTRAVVISRMCKDVRYLKLLKPRARALKVDETGKTKPSRRTFQNLQNMLR